MPKRHGNLFGQCFTINSLYAAYRRSRRGKRKTFSVMQFERNLGANLQALHDELHAGDYAPKPYKHFIVREPKPRQISAPTFRDVVVQHAAYAIINPLFDRTFISDNYGCRIGKGTHSASDQTQRFLREVDPASYTLQLDIRRFYYTIDRTILRDLIEHKIKDRRLVDLLMQFSDDGTSETGVPIGNLLSQLYALIYLNPMDHYIKRHMKVQRYVRYVDDFILWCDTRDQAIEQREAVKDYLNDNLKLTLSRWTIAPVKRGVNFVGFRTWTTRRFVRKHSLYTFSKSLKRNDIASLNSILGNAINTASHAHMSQRIRDERPHLIPHIASIRSRHANV